MSEIRTKLLGLSVLAMAFAGLSYGQTITGVYSNPNPYNPTIRAEGETELVSDAAATFTNTGGTASNGSTVTVTVSAMVTSKAITTTTTFSGNSDAVLQVTPTGGVATVYPGIVSGNTITFTGVTLPVGGFTVQVSNVRVNASAASNPQITETFQVIYNNSVGQGLVAPITGGAPPVGYATPSLSVAIAQNASNQNIFYTLTATSFATCNGEPLSTSSTAPADTIAYTLNISELVAGAFKVMAGTGVYSPSSEAGTYQNTLGGATLGAATSATQLQVSFANIPSAATIYLPISVTVGGTTLSLLGNNVALTTPNALAVINPGVVAFTPSGGVVTATYAVTGVPATGSLKAIFPLNVYMNVAANAAPVQTTAMTVAVTYAPVVTVSGPATSVPAFAASAIAPLNTLTVTPCQTTLIFPFVTNASGFETGIAIANTTTDNLASNGTKSSATPTSGTCTINFYGNVATQPAAYVTPSIGAFSSSQTPVYANTLTSMAVPNFTGYAVALCNFLDAHAFAYIVDNFGQSSGTAEGYVANAINGANRGGADGGQGQ